MVFWRVTGTNDELCEEVEAREGVLSMDTAMVFAERSLLSSCSTRESRNFAVELNKEGPGMRPKTIEPYCRGSCRLACSNQFPAPNRGLRCFRHNARECTACARWEVSMEVMVW